MQRSLDRIYTTHVGSLARPPALLDLMQAAAGRRQADPAELAAAERRAVADVVARQRAAGLDVISDGEQSKTGFFAYVGQRLSGFEPRPGRGPMDKFRAEIDSFPEYYEQYFTQAMTGGMAVPAVPLGCAGRCPTSGRNVSGATWTTSARRSATPIPTRSSFAPWRPAGSAAMITTPRKPTT